MSQMKTLLLSRTIQTFMLLLLVLIVSISCTDGNLAERYVVGVENITLFSVKSNDHRQGNYVTVIKLLLLFAQNSRENIILIKCLVMVAVNRSL